MRSKRPRGILAWTAPGAAAILMVTAGLFPAATQAADNTATGDIAGVGADLTNSNTFTLNASQLALVKTAFLTDGTQLSSGDTLPRGTRVQFMVYIDNSTAFGVDDVNVSDALVAGFSYQTNSIRVDNTVATGSGAAAIYAAVSVAPLLSDANDADVAGISGATITAGSTGGNAQLDIAASMVWSMLFDVTVQ